MNSTYLEVVDRCYAFRGIVGSVMGSIAIVVIVVTLAILPSAIRKHDDFIVNILMFAVLLWPLLALCLHGLYRDFFDLTHNPIRLNRKNRMVYVFLYTGKMVSVPWDELVFCSGKAAGKIDLRAHIMDKDGVTVRHTIGFAKFGFSAGDLRDYVSFLGFYMNKGSEKLLPIVRRCLPIDGCREPLVFGLSMLMSLFGKVFGYLMLPIVLYDFFWRTLTMLTCKVPVWPDWVEAECQVAPDNPYTRTAKQDEPLGCAEPLDPQGFHLDD